MPAGSGAATSRVGRCSSPTSVPAAGLQPGDLLLQLGAGAVFGLSDVSFFCREHDAGDEVEVVWARDGEIHRGRLRLDARETRAFELQA